MRKRRIGLLIVLALILAGSGTVLAMTISNVIKQKAVDEQLKAQNEKTFITELFHDQGHIYMSPMEPKKGETVTIRLRTLRYNVSRAQIQYTTDEGVTWKTSNMEYEKQDDTGYYDLWKGELIAEGDSVRYRFIVSNVDILNTVYYDTKGIVPLEGSYTDCWQFVPGHDVPDWAMGALWYNLMPDAFYNGNTTNDKQTSGYNTYTAWNQLHKGLSDKYGGDLDGIENQLGYIKSLNVDAIYMNPIFKSYQNAGYGPVKYDEVESTFGNEKDLVELADAIHERDMKLMGDVVLTFTTEDSYYFDSNNLWPTIGASESEDSIYKDMYEFYNWPEHFMTAWSSPALDLNTDVAKNMLYTGENAYLTRYAEIFDAYRFDCGGWLWGTTDTDAIPTETFVREIREVLKAQNEDFFMLTEADWKNMNNGTWDAQWNIDYMEKLQDYAKGLINETLMTEAMFNYEMTIPRNVALSLHNMMCDHDSYRVVQEDDYMYNAALLLQTTYLGAPSIFYGEEMGYIHEPENGVGDIKSFYSLDWDESNWSQSRLNFYKAIGELREEYSCVKTGVVNMLSNDIQNNTIVYGRWDTHGATITVTSQNEENIEVEIAARKCDIEDGTVLTDWFTGKEYVVKDGKVTVEVIPGGSVFVTGEKSSTYRQGFVQSEIGNTSKKDEAYTENSLSFVAEGKGTIEKKSDKFTYINKSAYGACSVYGNIRGDGKGVLMLRNSLDKDDLYYAAVVNGKNLSILVRNESGQKAETIVKTKCTNNTYVKLERTSDNTFTAYVAEVANGSLGEWTEVEGSTISLNTDKQIHYGFGALKGEVNVNNVTFVEGSKQATYDNFDSKSCAALFDNVNAEFATISGGKLTIKNSKKQKESFLLTNSMDNDWTFKTKMAGIDSEVNYAGVVCQQNEDNYIIAGRTVIDNNNRLFIGEVTNGVMKVCSAVQDAASDKDVIIQLQRTGAHYSVVYSVDNGETWNYIGKTYMNFSEEKVGLLVAGAGTVSFDWVSFGNSIEDEKSTNTPYSPVEVDVAYNNEETNDEASYEFLTGKWSIVAGGWQQDKQKGFSQASAVNNVYTDLYAESSIKMLDGDGWAGLAFGKQEADTDASDGFVLQYMGKGKIALTYKGKEIATAKVDVEKDESLRLVINAADGNITVYAGQEPVPVINLQDTAYESGYVSLCTEDAKAHFGNFHHGYTSANWKWISGNGSGVGEMLATKDTSSEERQIHSIGTLTGYAFTDYVCTGKIAVEKVEEDLATKSGFLLGTSEGSSATVSGVFVYLDATGHLKLDVDGTEKASYNLPKNTKAVNVMVVKHNRVYKVYIDGQSTPVLEYQEDFDRGGMFTVYTINGNGSFQKLDIENLQPNQSTEESEIVKAWASVGSTPLSDNFAGKVSENNYASYNTADGVFEVKDGVLTCSETSGWTAGTTVIGSTYSDFTMEFKLRIDAKSNGWMSVGLRKATVDGTHNDTGISLMINPNGGIFFFNSVDKKNVGTAKIGNAKVGEWLNVKIVAQGSVITAYVNGQKMSTITDDTFFDGFISFTSGMTKFSVDDLKITPMK